ncbi:hypothetical protein D6D04_10555, partial [Aureobasidium pullulans]
LYFRQPSYILDSDDSDNFDNNDDSDSDDSDSDRDNGTRQTVSSTSNTAKSYKANYLKKDATTSDSSKIVMKPVVKSSAKATLNNDPELKGKLKEASKNVPRYLFRVWDSSSGGNSELNTTSAVTPHAHYHKANHASVYDMTRREFIVNTSVHLVGSDEVLSEFSSWSHSPYFAFHHAKNRNKQSGTAHVAIIDTEELASSNPAFHVPVLGKILNLYEPYTYDEEFLIHGVIKGKFYKAVPFTKLHDLGLITQLPALKLHNHAFGRGATYALPKEVIPYSVSELSGLKRIALVYGTTFAIPFAIVLFCCKRRPGFFSTLEASDLNKIASVLGGRQKVPLQWAGSRSVFCDGVVPEKYQVSEQMANLMRALHEYAWGKGVRGRERIAAIIMDSNSEDSSSDDDFDPEKSGRDADSHSDEEGIVSSMSAMRMNPTAHMNSREIDHPQPVSIQKLPSPRPLVPNGKSRKRARLSVLSFGPVPAPWNHLPTRSVPPSSISSPYALWATDYYESGMGMANTEVTDLYAASKESQSTILHPDKIKHACITGHLVATWCVSKFNYRRLSYYKKLEFWISTNDFTCQYNKGVHFRCSDITGQYVWYAILKAGSSVKINGCHFQPDDTMQFLAIGPLPSFSVWECDDGVVFLYVGIDAISYEAPSDDESENEIAPKRQKR